MPLQVDVNVKDDDDNTQLMLAADRGDVVSLKALLEAKADPNIQNKFDGKTALIYAAINNHARCVEVLLEAKAQPHFLSYHEDCSPEDGSTALRQAARLGLFDTVKILIHHASLSDTLEAITMFANSESGRADLIDQLLATIKNVNACSPYMSVLTIAAAFASVAYVKQLLAVKANINQRTHEGDTALSMAVLNERKDCVIALLEAKADPNKGSPLVTASYVYNIEIAQILLNAKADINNKFNRNTWTPLMQAADSGLPDIIKFLLEKKADVNAAIWTVEVPPKRVSALSLAIHSEFAGQLQQAECISLLKQAIAQEKAKSWLSFSCFQCKNIDEVEEDKPSATIIIR